MPPKKSKLGVLFVCMGNICRSPTAEGVFQHVITEAGLAGSIQVDSAATHDYHPGKPPDVRTQAAAARRGYDLSRQRARVLTTDDFATFDFLLAMDRDNLAMMQRMALGAEQRDKVSLFLAHAPQLGEDEVPDPYFGDGDGFDLVLDMIEEATGSLLDHLRQHL